MIKLVKIICIALIIIYTVTSLNSKYDDVINNNDKNTKSNSTNRNSINHKNRNRNHKSLDDNNNDDNILTNINEISTSSKQVFDIMTQFFDLFGQKINRKIHNWVRKNANFKSLPTDDVIYEYKPIVTIEYDENNGNIDPNLSWGGIKVTEAERSTLLYIKIMREKLRKTTSFEYGSSSSWLFTATDKEILRFVRAQIAHKEDAWRSILNHAKWRNSKYGADEVSDFADNFMHYEIFWLGLNKQGCPTLIVRTVAHDGTHYDENPELFSAFFTSVLEKGRQLYGVGTEKQVCMILDRFPFDHPTGVTKKEDEKLDFSVIKNLLNLFQHLYSTLINHYPEILDHARVMPASWVFKACYKITSRVMDRANRKKFLMISHTDINKEISSLFPPDVLPEHFGGTAQLYGGLPASKAAKEVWNKVYSNSDSNNSNMPRKVKDNNSNVEISVVDMEDISDLSEAFHPSFNSDFYPSI